MSTNSPSSLSGPQHSALLPVAASESYAGCKGHKHSVTLGATRCPRCRRYIPDLEVRRHIWDVLNDCLSSFQGPNGFDRAAAIDYLLSPSSGLRVTVDD